MLSRRTPPLALTALLAAAAAQAPGRASACSEADPPEFTLTAIMPAAGATSVPRDTGILVTGEPSYETAYNRLDVVVTLTDVETGRVVPGRSIHWSSEEATAAWYPDEPLLPGRTYHVEVIPASTGGIPIDGSTPISASFVTSSALLEPLAFSGDIQVTVNAYDATVQECEYPPCGPASNCVDVGTRRALRARLDLPAVVGGQPDAGQYRALLYFNDEKTPDVTQPNLEGVVETESFRIAMAEALLPTAGQTVQLDQELFEEDFDYTPCFTYVVWDPAGHKIQTSHCLPVLTQAQYADATDAPALAQVPSGTLDDTATASASSASASDDALLSGAERNPIDAQSAGSGCTFGSTPTTPGAVFVALAALLGGLARRRSRRQQRQ